MAKNKVRPPADLAPRNEGDEDLTPEQIEKISLFAQLTESPDFHEFPGSIVLRRYRPGEVICRLGEAGWTAFYILTAADLAELRETQLASPEGASERRQRYWRDDLAQAKPRAGKEPRKVASVTFNRPEDATLWGRLKSLPMAAAGKATTPRSSKVIPLFEGDIFGEMSCIYRMPRSATITVDADCIVLEYLQNILNLMLSNRNKKFKEQIDTAYRKRVLEGELRRIPLFAGLPEAAIAQVSQKAELKEFDPGELIWDEHDPADGMYIVRSGYVQVRKGVTYLLGERSVRNWREFGQALTVGSYDEGTPHRKIWDALSKPAQAAAPRAAAGEELEEAEWGAILGSLNALLRQPKFTLEKEFAPARATFLKKLGMTEAEAKKLPTSTKKWKNHQEVCRFNRLFLESLVPGLVPVPLGDVGGRVLNYSSAGQELGEVGLVTGRPRSATCVAYDHPDWKFGRVEMVRISKQLFDDLKAKSPDFSRRVAEIAARRQSESIAKMAQPVWDETNALTQSERFDELGLIQGQKLFVIDLERCTRCDECVKACVASHDDGRSRLFLDGPRFRASEGGRVVDYLVPATCRQCKDPVCLIQCPVASIHKGTNQEIVVEDWCIGCGRCAEQCPYGSILMHPVGVLPRRSNLWRVRAAPERAAGSWVAPDYNDARWETIRTPVLDNRETRTRFKTKVLHFRHEFDIPRALAAEGRLFHVQVTAAGPETTVWVNGVEVTRCDTLKPLPAKPFGDKGEKWTLEARLAVRDRAEAKGELTLGRNVIAVATAAPAKAEDVWFEAGVYHLKRPAVAPGLSGEYQQELVMNTAVVCDLCSDTWWQQPACVHACPHGAAQRVNAKDRFMPKS